MLTEEQIQAIATALGIETVPEGAGEKLSGILSPVIQSSADSVVAEQLKGIKANRDEFKRDLDPYKALGKPDDLKAKLDELETLRGAKGKKVDPKEIEELVNAKLEDRVSTFRAEQEALRKSIAEEREAYKSTAETAIDKVLAARRREVILQHAQGLKPLMAEFYEKRIGPMLQPVEGENGEEWWKKDVVKWQVTDPETGAPLTGKAGHKTPAELIEDGRMGLGDKPWNSKEFRDTFFQKQGKGGGYEPGDGISVPKPGAVDPTAPSHVHGAALFGEEA